MNIIHLLIWALTTSASASPDECHFTDVVAAEVRECVDGPAEESWDYLYVDDHGVIRMHEEFLAKFPLIATVMYQDVGGSADPAYDVAEDDVDDVNAIVEFIRFLVKFLIAAGDLGAAIELNGLTGTYTGTLGANGTTAPAVMYLQHDGPAVTGSMWVQGDLHLEGGICPDYDLSMIGFPINATETFDRYHAHLHTEREVDLFLFFNGTVGVDAHMELSQSDYQTLTATIELDVQSPCQDQTITATFLRDNAELGF
jgi:hypothetical protein